MNISVLVIALITMLLESKVVAEPHLSAPRIVDVGVLQLNESRQFKFAVENITGEAIEITGINASCSCITLRLDGAETISSGAKRTLSGTVVFGGSIGAYETKIDIAYQAKSGISGKLTVPVRCLMIAAVVLDKSVVDFGKVDLHAGVQIATVEARRGNSGEEWDAIQPIPGSEHLDVSILKDADAGYRLLVKFDPSKLPIAGFRDTIKLRLLQKGEALSALIEFSVTARVIGPLKVTPDPVYLGAVNKGQQLEKVLTVSSRGLDLNDLIVSHLADDLQARIEHLGNGTAKVHLGLTAPSSEGSLNRTLTLYHIASGIEVKIPVFGLVADGDERRRFAPAQISAETEGIIGVRPVSK